MIQPVIDMMLFTGALILVVNMVGGDR